MAETEHDLLTRLRGLRYIALTAALLLFVFLVFPLQDALGMGGTASRTLFSLIVFFAAYSTLAGRGTAALFALFGLPALVGNWVDLAALGETYLVGHLVFTTVFLLLAAVRIVRAVLAERTVTADTVFGGVAAYLLYGVACAVDGGEGAAGGGVGRTGGGSGAIWRSGTAGDSGPGGGFWAAGGRGGRARGCRGGTLADRCGGFARRDGCTAGVCCCRSTRTWCCRCSLTGGRSRCARCTGGAVCRCCGRRWTRGGER